MAISRTRTIFLTTSINNVLTLLRSNNVLAPLSTSYSNPCTSNLKKYTFESTTSDNGMTVTILNMLSCLLGAFSTKELPGPEIDNSDVEGENDD